MMTYKNILKYLSVICLIFNTTVQDFNAQNDSLKMDEIYVVKEFNPVVSSNGNKVLFSPKIIKSSIEKKPTNYSFINKDYPITFNPSPINAARMKKESLNRLYKSYLKVGIGNYLSTQAEGHFSSTRSSKKMIGAHFSHKGSSAKIKNTGFAGYSENNVGLFAEKFGRKKVFSSKVNYNYNTYHYYGYDPVFFPELNKKNTDVYYSKPSIELNLYDYPLTKDTITSTVSNIGFKYQYQIDHLKTNEHNPILSYKLTKPVNTDLLEINTLLDINTAKQLDSINSASTIFYATPSFKTRKDKLSVSLGAGIFVNGETETKLYFKPIIDARYNLVQNIIVPYIGITGDVRRNNYSSLALINPYINSNFISLKNTNQQIKLYGGIRSEISNEITTDVNISYEQLQNTPLFINDTFGIINNQFIVVYEDMSITKFNVSASYNVLSNLEINSSVEYNIFDLSSQLKAWHRPSLVVNAGGRYNIQNKLILSTNIIYNGIRYAKIYGIEDGFTTTFQSRELKAFLDLNIGAEYRYSKKISAFAYLNNITGGRYLQWYNYPVQPINIIGGVSMLF